MSAACRPASTLRMFPLASRTGRGHVTPRAERCSIAREKRQIVGIDALFVDRQDERALRRVHEIVRVLDALGDSLVRQKFAEPISADELRSSSSLTSV